MLNNHPQSGTGKPRPIGRHTQKSFTLKSAAADPFGRADSFRDVLLTIFATLGIAIKLPLRDRPQNASDVCVNLRRV